MLELKANFFFYFRWYVTEKQFFYWIGSISIANQKHGDDVIIFEPDKMTFDLVMSDWIDEYEIFKIAPGPIEIDSKIFVTDWTVHHKWYKAGIHEPEPVLGPSSPRTKQSVDP